MRPTQIDATTKARILAVWRTPGNEMTTADIAQAFGATHAQVRHLLTQARAAGEIGLKRQESRRTRDACDDVICRLWNDESRMLRQVDVAAAVGLSPTQVTDALKRLVRQGRVTRPLGRVNSVKARQAASVVAASKRAGDYQAPSVIAGIRTMVRNGVTLPFVSLLDRPA